MNKAEFLAEISHLTEPQALTVWVHHESGWEWIGETDDHVMMQRPATIETMSTIYILPEGYAVTKLNNTGAPTYPEGLKL